MSILYTALGKMDVLVSNRFGKDTWVSRVFAYLGPALSCVFRYNAPSDTGQHRTDQILGWTKHELRTLQTLNVLSIDKGGE